MCDKNVLADWSGRAKLTSRFKVHLQSKAVCCETKDTRWLTWRKGTPIVHLITMNPSSSLYWYPTMAKRRILRKRVQCPLLRMPRDVTWSPLKAPRGGNTNLRTGDVPTGLETDNCYQGRRRLPGGRIYMCLCGNGEFRNLVSYVTVTYVTTDIIFGSVDTASIYILILFIITMCI